MNRSDRRFGGRAMLSSQQFLPQFATLRGFATCQATQRVCTLLVCVMFVFASGCTSLRDYVHNGFKVGPNYQKPPAPVADHWIDSKSKGVNVATKDLSDW